MHEWIVDWGQPWFHGSNLELEVLRPRSTITQWVELAKAFSHRPSSLWIDDQNEIGHNGLASGFLYVVAETVKSDDLEPVPGSTMADGLEWHTRRPLKVRRISVLPIQHEV